MDVLSGTNYISLVETNFLFKPRRFGLKETNIMRLGLNFIRKRLKKNLFWIDIFYHLTAPQNQFRMGNFGAVKLIFMTKFWVLTVVFRNQTLNL
jgi:hypothetical protein